MGNLGLYQKIVVWAKKLGGPSKLLALIALGGYGLFRGGEAIIRKIVSYMKSRNSNQEDENVFLNSSPILVIKQYSDSSVSLSPGDKYNIIAIDDEVAIIEIIGDDNNPYVVRLPILRDISYTFAY